MRNNFLYNLVTYMVQYLWLSNYSSSISCAQRSSCGSVVNATDLLQQSWVQLLLGPI